MRQQARDGIEEIRNWVKDMKLMGMGDLGQAYTDFILESFKLGYYLFKGYISVGSAG